MAEDFKKLNESLKELFSEDKRLRNSYHNNALESAWSDVAGSTVARYTSKINIKDHTLYVYISSAPLKQELLFAKEQLLIKVNQKLEYIEIKELAIL